MPQEVGLEAVDHVHSLVEDLLVDAAIHEEALGTEHLGHLGEHRGAALGHQHVGEPAYGGVGGDAGQTVGATALHADHQFRGGDGLPACFAGVVRQLFQQYPGGREFVLHLLAGEEFHPLFVVVAQLGQELLVG